MIITGVTVKAIVRCSILTSGNKLLLLYRQNKSTQTRLLNKIS